MLDRWVSSITTTDQRQTGRQPRRRSDQTTGAPLAGASPRTASARKPPRVVLNPIFLRTGLAIAVICCLGVSATEQYGRRCRAEVDKGAASQFPQHPYEGLEEGIQGVCFDAQAPVSAATHLAESAGEAALCSGNTAAVSYAPEVSQAAEARWLEEGGLEATVPDSVASAADAELAQKGLAPYPATPLEVQFIPPGPPGGGLTEPEPVPTPDPLEPITLHLGDVDVRKALEMLSAEGAVSILVSPGVTGRVTANLRGLSLEETLNAILKLCNLVAYREKDLIFVYPLEQAPQLGRNLQAFPLDFVAAQDVLQGVNGLLSPVGNASVMESSEDDNRRTRDVIVVEDVPDFLHRIGQYIEAIDVPPRQVLIEVHVLEVELDDDKKHGVNFDHAIHFLGNQVNLKVSGFASAAAPQAFFIDVDGANLEALVEMLKKTTDAKTLASPKVLVLNGQQSRIQIGERLGYRVTTVTETAAVQDVKFLEVGVVLDVTPHISRDNQVILHVNPKVASGEITEAELPEEETTEVETDVCLFDGQGIVIGGLIQEKDSNVQSKVPLLGDIWLIGTLFQQRQIVKKRHEIIITLVPRVVPYLPDYEEQDRVETIRAATPLLHGPLYRYPRPWEPRLPDALLNPRIRRLPRVAGATY